MKNHRRNDKRSSQSTSVVGVSRDFKLASSVNRIFSKRIVGTNVVTSNGSGLIVATTMASSNSVTSVGDFGSVAAIYSNYRVKAMRLTAKPFYKVNTTAVVVSPMIAVIPFRSGLVPTTFANFTESSECRYCSGYEGYVFETSNKGYPDGKLWHPTNAVISSADSYGIAVMGQNYVAGTASTNVWYLSVEYLIEFSVEG